MNIDFSPSFTVSYVCFVLDRQQSVSHLHRLSSVDRVNESVCASLYPGEQGQNAVTSGQANHSDCWTCAVSNSLGRIPNLSNNDNLLIENLKIVWQEMNNFLFIFNNTCEMKWHLVWGIVKKERGSDRVLNDEWHIFIHSCPTCQENLEFENFPRTSWIHHT